MCRRLIAASSAAVLCLSLCPPAEGAEAPKINSWSNTKTGDRKVAFRVKPAEAITFSAKAQGAEKYIWKVNGSLREAAETDSFKWTAPNKKGLWKVEVIATNKSQEQYVRDLAEGFRAFPWMRWDRRNRKTRKWVPDTSKKEIAESVKDGYYPPRSRKEWIVSTFLKAVRPGESIAKAIDAVPAEGGIVELLGGAHDVKETISVNKSNIAILGSRDSEIRSHDSAKHIFSLNENWEQKIQLKNITFKGFKVTSTYDKHGRNILIYGMRVDNLTIRNVKDLSFVRGFVHMNWRKDSRDRTQKPRCEVLRVFNNMVRNSTMMSCGCWNSVVAYNHVSGKYPPGACYGMLFEAGNTNISIHHNYMENTATNGNIQTESYAAHIFSNVCTGSQRGITARYGPVNGRVENNTVSGASVAGIECVSQGGLKNIYVRNNRIFNCSGHGVIIGEPPWMKNKSGFCSAIVTNNIIYNCGGDGVGKGPNRADTPWTVTITNNIIANNAGYGINLTDKTITETHSYNNIWNNKKGNYNQSVPGAGDISADPLFADASKGDFHISSTAGRWDAKAGKWVKDKAHSPCIDAGDPKTDSSKEPAPNGRRTNMGAYGNTGQASMTSGE